MLTRHHRLPKFTYHCSECEECQQEVDFQWNGSLPSNVLKQSENCVQKKLYQCDIQAADSIKSKN